MTPGRSTSTIRCRPGPFTVNEIIWQQTKIYTYHVFSNQLQLSLSDNNKKHNIKHISHQLAYAQLRTVLFKLYQTFQYTQFFVLMYMLHM